MNKLILLAVLLPVLQAQSARDIVVETQKRARAASQRYTGTLQVLDAKGKVSDKRWEYERLGAAGESKAILKFTAPAEVKGVALLVVNHPDRASDQWMWTPAVGRERRIAFQDRSTRFFGTDFSFEDLEERDVEQYEYRLVGDATVNGAACWKLESRPREAKASQYSYSHVWIRKDSYTFAQIESFRQNELIRRLQYLDLERVQNIWTPRRIEVEDVKRKGRTVLKLEKLEYNVTLDPAKFTVQALRRES
ncbi:MAG: outer membrane lipoprotein-sorting protein [Bryobacteraceae bacterium]|nr:outer membrane lipoprotein-sorting protein [Bryobacteraceae bacterium]